MKKVIFTIANGIAELHLNRPEKHNAFDAEMIYQITDYLKQAAASDDVSLLLVTAAGPNFSAGADLKWMQQIADYSFEENLQDAQTLSSMMHQFYTFPKPSIALIQGSAFGGALGIIACCDLALGAQNSRFCFSETRIGLIPAVISPYIAESIGIRQARHLFLTAEQFDAQTAYTYGLLTELVEDEQALERRKQVLIQQLLANSPEAMGECKTLLRSIAHQPIDLEVQHTTVQAIAKVRISDMGQEGLKAFLEKRPAKWVI